MTSSASEKVLNPKVSINQYNNQQRLGQDLVAMALQAKSQKAGVDSAAPGTLPGDSLVLTRKDDATTDTVTPEVATTESTATAPNKHPGYGEELPPGGIYRDGKIFHKVRKGETLRTLASDYLRFTGTYTTAELREQIAKANGLKKAWVVPGMTIEIPNVRLTPPQPKPSGVPPSFDSRGVYVPSVLAATDRIFKIAQDIKAAGGNTMVLDIKDGFVAIRSKDPKVRAMSEWDSSIRDLPKLVERLHQMGIHVAVRLALFHDPVLAKKRPDLAIHSKSQPDQVWRENGKLVWVDPSHPEVQDFNLKLAEEAAQSGVDEIQFDYVRFPAQGNTRDAKYSFDDSKTPKHVIISDFLRKARETLKPYNVLISADIYGILAWGQEVDQRITGQRPQEMAKHVDVLNPMLYPSHFAGPYDGFKRPADQPYHFYSEGVKRLRRMIGPDTTIRPWIQAFPYKVSHYDADYVKKQIAAGYDAKGTGYTLWNAGADYRIGYAGMKAADPKPDTATKQE